MKKLVLNCLIILLGLASAFNVFAAGDAAKGKALFAVCAACHGATGEGNPMLNSPATAGLADWYLVRQIQNFRTGLRGSHPKDTFGMQMKPMAMTLANDQAVQDVAAYIASLPRKPPAKTVKGNVEAGKTAYAVCMACHGPDGKGIKDMNSAALNNQYDWYLVRQIKNFKAGIRAANAKDTFGAQMKPMAMLLTTDQQINDVVAYISTLK